MTNGLGTTRSTGHEVAPTTAAGSDMESARTPLVAEFADYPTRSDTDLLEGCRAGDGAAWEALIGRYERLVFSVAMRNGLSREDAADVTQATFMVLLESLDRLHSEQRLASWLMTVARRHAWRIRRRQQRVQPWAAVDTGPAEDPIGRWEQVADVLQGLRQLGHPCRELLLALYFDAEKPSYLTIASRLGYSVGSIGPARARCLRRLRAILGEVDDADVSS